ncbi:MAG TPA: hypothetical protein VFJ20_07095, partial [Gemmatimonadaceae bacterium]|nr:hypothetical protein [Gemmatimonadaceae bacterium]
MSDATVTQKLSTEGADPLTLAGVNDGNLMELSRLGGVRVTLRGDTMTITGSPDFVERAAGIAVRMIEAARQRLDLTPDDVLRMGDLVDRGEYDDGEAPTGTETVGGNGAMRIALPGIR